MPDRRCHCLSVATARRCLYMLDAIGYVRANRNGAVSGPLLARLAAGSEPLDAACGPILDALHADRGVAVSLALFRDGEPIIMAGSSSDSILKLQLPVGAAMPVHCTSAGKIFLACLSPEALAQTLRDAKLVAYTPHTLTPLADLSAAVEQVARQGFAISDQEFVVGTRTAAAPVSDGQGKIIISVNASMLAPAVPLRDVRARIIPALARAATLLSQLGL